MIEIKNLTKSYSDTAVYENFNLTVEEGKITCILGESGSGKTTLLNAVANLTEYGGEITHKKCSYIFQLPRLVPNLTVFGNLKLICNDEEKINSILQAVKLSDKAQSYPINLSGGQKQRVSIARAFLYESEIILMDEPFSSLDLKIKNEMINLFFDLWKNDKRTALFVTHDLFEALSVAHRILVLKNGAIAFDEKFTDEPPRNYTEDQRKRLTEALLSD